MRLTRHLKMRKTPQVEAVPGAGQVRNEAGGHVWAIDRWQLLHRFLILGTEGGTYYASERSHTRRNADNLVQLLDEDGPRVVKAVTEVSRSGRAPKVDSCLFALALATALGDEATRKAAYSALPSVARTGSHLFQFAAECQELRGWGRGLRSAVSRWYNGHTAEDLAYQMVKYRQRGGWTHGDLLRLAHPKPASAAHGSLYRWAVDGTAPVGLARVAAFESAQRETDLVALARLVREHDLPWEALPPAALDSREVWSALLERMPLTAMLRNLATMTRCGVLAPGSAGSGLVVSAMTDAQRLRASRLHPLTILTGLATYQSGRGPRGKGVWAPVPEVLDALDAAFGLATGLVEPTGLRHLVAVDVSGSMSHGSVAGSPLTPRAAAAALALVSLRTEASVLPMAFSHRFEPLGLHSRMGWSEAARLTDGMNFSATDCALPMVWAKENRAKVDVFVVLTDNETWFGDVHPFQALREYRDWSGRSARLVVVGMTATGFSIADPRDAGMLDVVGFDSAAPSVVREWLAG